MDTNRDGYGAGKRIGSGLRVRWLTGDGGSGELGSGGAGGLRGESEVGAPESRGKGRGVGLGEGDEHD